MTAGWYSTLPLLYAASINLKLEHSSYKYLKELHLQLDHTIEYDLKCVKYLMDATNAENGIKVVLQPTLDAVQFVPNKQLLARDRDLDRG